MKIKNSHLLINFNTNPQLNRNNQRLNQFIIQFIQLIELYKNEIIDCLRFSALICLLVSKGEFNYSNYILILTKNFISYSIILG